MTTLILLSGGVDSIVLAETKRRAGESLCAVFFDYGQPARSQEWQSAFDWCESNKVTLHYQTVELSGMDAMNEQTGRSGARVVPARNLVLLAHAANLALAHGYEEIVYGANKADLTGYADCRQDFVIAADTVCSLLGVRVRAPLLFTDKATIVSRAREWNLTWWSCYTPTTKGTPCQTCNACKANA
jgi:7-cyano-7-deazaguanine synthase